MTAAAWPKAATSRCTTTANPSARAASNGPSHGLLRRRGLRRGRRHRITRLPGLRPHRQQVLRQIDWVQFDIGDDSHDHLIKAEDRLTIAMARQ